MKTSRLANQTLKLFNSMPQRTSPPPRRITRSSLARFAYRDDSSTKENQTPDIEDAIADIDAAVASRKRKRTTTVTTTTTIIPNPTSKSKPPPRRKAIKTEKEEEEEEQEVKLETKDAATNATPQKQKQQRKPARKTVDPSTGTTRVSPPSNWEAMYSAVKAMRSAGGPAANAAVDTMGCERLALADASPRDQRLHTLIALMLSSQTKDTTNAAAMRRLQTELPAHKPGAAAAGLNLENLLAVEPDELNRLIWAVGFHNNKTKHIKQAAAVLRDRWGGDIPDSIEGLTSLPGVGPKMAYLCLSAAWGRTEGIGVDVHVHRITNLWGWHATRNPEETRAALQSWLPRDRWREINWLLVGFGQTVCAPVGRRCGECVLGLDGLCKAAERKKVVEGRKVREAKVEVGDGGLEVKVKEEEEEQVERDVVVNESS